MLLQVAVRGFISAYRTWRCLFESAREIASWAEYMFLRRQRRRSSHTRAYGSLGEQVSCLFLDTVDYRALTLISRGIPLDTGNRSTLLRGKAVS